MKLSKRMLATAIAASTILGVGAYAWAENQPADPRVTATQQQPADPGANGLQRGLRHRAGVLGRRAIHGDLIVKGRAGQFENVSFDKGKVTAVSATSITIERPDGQSVTKTIDGDTKFRGVDGWQGIKTDKGALVVSKGDKAVMIGQRDGNFPGRPGVDAGEGQVPAT